MIALFLALAAAQPVDGEGESSESPPVVDTDEANPEDPGIVKPKPRFGGIGIPIITFNSTDGLTLGAGGELFRKPADGSDGFIWKIQSSAVVTTSLAYQSYYVGLETRAGDWQWFTYAKYEAWTNMLYAGDGGADVYVLDDGREGGNLMRGPLLMVSVRRPVAMNDRLAVFVQSWSRQAEVRPAEGSLLADRAPVGSQGGVYSDLTVGLEYEEIDRWPLPYRGRRGEVDVRAGLGHHADDTRTIRPLVGAHVDVAAYLPVIAERMVLGVRVNAERASAKPFFEQPRTAGRRRDEIGLEQSFMGYGRTRTRGDGSLAALAELRTLIVESNHPVWDLEVHASLFAEEGFIHSQRVGLGPHMPTVGGGPVLLWQGGTVLRPFAAWGWRAETPGGDRFPVMQFGISLMDPL